MKIKKITEEYDWNNFLKHLKHLEEYKNDERLENITKTLEGQLKAFKNKWDAIADYLSKSVAGKALSDDVIVGYVKSDGRFVKYDKNNNDFVVYTLKGNPKNPKYITISMHKKSLDEYNKIVKRDFFDELPENKNNKNL